MNLRRITLVLVAATLVASALVGTSRLAAAAPLRKVVGAGATANTMLEIGPALVTPRSTQVFFCDLSVGGRCPTYDRLWADFVWNAPVSGLVDCAVVHGRTWFGRLAIDADSGDVWSIKVVDGIGGQRDRIGVAHGGEVGDGRCGAARVRTKPLVAGDFEVAAS